MKLMKRLAMRLGRRRALVIAMRHCRPNGSDFSVFGRLPPGCTLYKLPEEPCWFVVAAQAGGSDAAWILRSSRLIVVSRKAGKILYDGSAHDEG